MLLERAHREAELAGDLLVRQPLHRSQFDHFPAARGECSDRLVIGCFTLTAEQIFLGRFGIADEMIALDRNVVSPIKRIAGARTDAVERQSPTRPEEDRTRIVIRCEIAAIEADEGVVGHLVSIGSRSENPRDVATEPLDIVPVEPIEQAIMSHAAPHWLLHLRCFALPHPSPLAQFIP